VVEKVSLHCFADVKIAKLRENLVAKTLELVLKL
jgi:hypothetical protein